MTQSPPFCCKSSHPVFFLVDLFVLSHKNSHLVSHFSCSVCCCKGLSRHTTVTGGARSQKRGDKRYFSANMDWWTDGGQDGWEEGEHDRKGRIEAQWALQRRELSIVPFASNAALPRWQVSVVTPTWRLVGRPSHQTCCQCHRGC